MANQFAYQRAIKLSPALGDWTTLKPLDLEKDEIEVSPIYDVGFDSLPKAQLKYVHKIHYQIADQLVRQLSSDMDIKVELHTVSAAQLSYQAFVDMFQDQIVQMDFNLSKIGRINTLIKHDLASVILDRLVGGSGENDERESFSEVEHQILQAQLKKVGGIIEQQWKSIFSIEDSAIKFHSGQYEVNKAISQRDSVIVFSFELVLGKSELSKVLIAYPNPVLCQLLTLRQKIKEPFQQRVVLSDKTKEALKIDVKVRLGNAKLTMDELRHLQVGDVITLDTKLDSPLEVVYRDVISMWGQPGVMNEKLCVQLIFLKELLEKRLTMETAMVTERLDASEKKDELAVNVQSFDMDSAAPESQLEPNETVTPIFSSEDTLSAAVPIPEASNENSNIQDDADLPPVADSPISIVDNEENQNKGVDQGGVNEDILEETVEEPELPVEDNSVNVDENVSVNVSVDETVLEEENVKEDDKVTISESQEQPISSEEEDEDFSWDDLDEDF